MTDSTSAVMPPLPTNVPPATAYAIRAWYTTLLSQTEAARDDLLSRAEGLNSEIERLHGQVDRADATITALRGVLDSVDDWIRRINEVERRVPNRGEETAQTGSGRRSSRGRSGGPGSRRRRGQEEEIVVEVAKDGEEG